MIDFALNSGTIDQLIIFCFLLIPSAVLMIFMGCASGFGLNLIKKNRDKRDFLEFGLMLISAFVFTITFPVISNHHSLYSDSLDNASPEILRVDVSDVINTEIGRDKYIADENEELLSPPYSDEVIWLTDYDETEEVFHKNFLVDENTYSMTVDLDGDYELTIIDE